MTETTARPRFSGREVALLAVLFGTAVVVSTGIQMGNPLFPSLSRLLDVPVERVALLVSVWAFTGLLSPLFGPFSDRFGAPTFVLLGLGAFTVGNLLCAVAPTFPVLAGLQVIVGLGYAVFSFSLSAAVGDAFAYETRGRAMGIVRYAVSISALLGVPAAMAIAEQATARASFAAVGVLGVVLAAVSLPVLRGVNRQQASDSPSTGEKTGFWHSLGLVLRQRSAVVSILVVPVWAAIPTGLMVYLAAWMEQTFLVSETQVGLAFSLVGVGALVGNTLTALISDRLGKKRSAVIGLAVTSIAAAVLPRWHGLAGVLATLTVFFAALEFCAGSLFALMTELVPSARGTMMSLVSLANGIGTGAVPVIMGRMFVTRGYPPITLVLGIAGLLTCAVLGFLVTERGTASETSSSTT